MREVENTNACMTKSIIQLRWKRLQYEILKIRISACKGELWKFGPHGYTNI